MIWCRPWTCSVTSACTWPIRGLEANYRILLQYRSLCHQIKTIMESSGFTGHKFACSCSPWATRFGLKWEVLENRLPTTSAGWLYEEIFTFLKHKYIINLGEPYWKSPDGLPCSFYQIQYDLPKLQWVQPYWKSSNSSVLIFIFIIWGWICKWVLKFWENSKNSSEVCSLEFALSV